MDPATMDIERPKERPAADEDRELAVPPAEPAANPDFAAAARDVSDDEDLAAILPEERGNLVARGFAALRLAFFSSLSRRIFVFNLAALVILLGGMLYLNQFRKGLIEARVESLLIQGRIVAGAIAASATVDTERIIIDPDKLLELKAGESAAPEFTAIDSLDSSINPERVAPLLRSLIQPTRTRARIYDREGIQVLDSNYLYAGGQVSRFDLPPLDDQDEKGMIARIGNMLNRMLQRRDLPIYEEIPGSGLAYPEVAKAMGGEETTLVRMTRQGQLIVSVALPVQRYRAVHGVLLLSTLGGDIDRIVAEERIAILRVFLVASAVTVLLSLMLASTIANPLRKLSEAAIRVRRGVKNRVEIPDFSRRQDEIGNLSTSLRAMTNALYARIEAIESFAADVSHELKNPLTSLRSAVETLPLARTEKSREQLLSIIQHDVRRLDRLITDISDASRLDAELARSDSTPVDMRALVEHVVKARTLVPGAHGRMLRVDLPRESDGFLVLGHESRLGQVLSNLIDNACSFAPKETGRIDVRLRHRPNAVEVTVEDNGPGIQAEAIDRIFERFYTDRPADEGFGQNSGLGLSISKQIIEAHGGSIRAANRKKPATGARFTVTLPALE
jgi:two-component system sensor histidine kinase ChvG